MEHQIQSRVFLVGAPRSGTTLLQSILGAHPEIQTFPESHFFCGLFPNPIRRHLRATSERWKTCFADFVKEIGQPDRQLAEGIESSRNGKTIADGFIELLDELTLEAGKQVWVEKTPNHISFARVIRSYYPDAKLIHLIRPGRDVVASLFDVSRRYPGQWGGEWSVDKCLGVWNRAVKKHRYWYGRENHLHVYFPEVVTQPQAVAQRLCAFIGIGYTDDMLERRQENSAGIMTGQEKWKEGVKGEIKKPVDRSSELFDAKTLAYIDSKLLKWPSQVFESPTVS